MIIHILAGGPVELLPELVPADEGDIWAGVDRGVFTLLSKGIVPQAAFGDFDSVSPDEMMKIREAVKKVRLFNPEKDETDMELAIIWALKQEPEAIKIYGGTGGRLDHFFGNVQLLIGPLLKGASTHIELIDSRNIIYAKGPGAYTVLPLENMKYVSFVPVTSHIKDLTLEGFKYPLKNKYVPLGSTLCISNELNHDYGTFSFTEGIIMVIRSHD
ncbi:MULTISPECIES: thiamine diphosphokinase [Bacillaceae]|uniref:Thiamine diphosphokinase n=1 Tax=Bacillus infantis TaxID=324767 RepID=A0A5D4SMN5_9BACI|nr:MULTISPECIES: thiamine diphosphokinase [Bacillus]OXT18777.1 thiamine diphosphokinase [Bacillus sp. OG2]MCK6203841.1 thiamine diphosphokinase [Bacillus infantis]MDT0159440.1 thiamine diphosphokinase [Bacillus sp. AG4(2022)]MDW2876993.1 thiamine diphosphokinase [Bacillus infantis]PLR72008.1 thiamine diphosphokinase [Bacillus sp. UMB0728]